MGRPSYRSSSRVLRRILVEATTVQSTDTTFANQAHLSDAFLAQIVGLYENTRLGRQEIYDAFRNYCRKRRGSEWVDYPADGHPEEDLMDALRGGIRDAMPEGGILAPALPQMHASRLS